jgi:YhcN/YlaJ family sporulation lipoprotein
MFTKATKSMVILVFAFSLVTAGCASKAKNQVKQQGTNMQQGLNTQQGPTMQQVPNQVVKKVENRFNIAQAASDRITRLKGVKGATVLVTMHNAYVAAVVNTPAKQVTKTLETQIAHEVRVTDPTIQHVYISTNPEFVDRVKQYVYAAKSGKPISGFFTELNKVIQRIFPAAR